MITVLLADDQAVVRAGVRTILEPAQDIQVVAEATDGLEAVALVASLRPDVVLMDIRMPTLNGIDATKRIAGGEHPTKVVVLTTYGLDQYLYDALLAGATGSCSKLRNRSVSSTPSVRRRPETDCSDPQQPASSSNGTSPRANPTRIRPANCNP